MEIGYETYTFGNHKIIRHVDKTHVKNQGIAFNAKIYLIRFAVATNNYALFSVKYTVKFNFGNCQFKPILKGTIGLFIRFSTLVSVVF